MLIWMVRGKLNGGISACGFSIDTYIHALIVPMYKNVQVIYCIVFFCRNFKLESFIYLIDLMYDCLLICFTLVLYIIRI